MLNRMRIPLLATGFYILLMIVVSVWATFAEGNGNAIEQVSGALPPTPYVHVTSVFNLICLVSIVVTWAVFLYRMSAVSQNTSSEKESA